MTEWRRDIHRHPELAFEESRTAGFVAETLREMGIEVATGIGGTGVVGVLKNGAGPTVMIRADMDGLPVQEKSGLANASTARQVGVDGVAVQFRAGGPGGAVSADGGAGAAAVDGELVQHVGPFLVRSWRAGRASWCASRCRAGRRA